MEKVAIAAMKQSGQFSLPEIIIGQELHHILQDTTADGRFIAYVPDKTSAPHLYTSASGHQNTLALIGPEGDFTPEEVELAEKSGFQSVSLGQTRLRTETAAITACHAIHIAHLL
jgi:16S rRNA (uracil1498-N3)-methyltransferase